MRSKTHGNRVKKSKGQERETGDGGTGGRVVEGGRTVDTVRFGNDSMVFIKFMSPKNVTKTSIHVFR